MIVFWDKKKYQIVLKLPESRQNRTKLLLCFFFYSLFGEYGVEFTR